MIKGETGYTNLPSLDDEQYSYVEGNGYLSARTHDEGSTALLVVVDFATNGVTGLLAPKAV